jgi:hypothetical protein
MSGIFLGIDPGKKGAIAAIEDGRVRSALRTTPHLVEGKAYRYHEMARVLRAVADTGKVVACTIEQGGAMPRQGVSTMFVCGVGYGLWVGIAAALNLPLELPRPNVWKRAMGVTKDKGSSIIMAERLFPGWSAKHKCDEAIAEALLLAEYGRRVREGGA